MINIWCHGNSSAVLKMNGQAGPVKVMKEYWKSENMAPPILNLGVRYIWVFSFNPRSRYCQGRSQRYPLNRMVCGGSHSRCGRFGKTKHKSIFPRPEIESWFLVHSARSPITILTTLRPLLITLGHYFIRPISIVSFCGLAYPITIGPLNDALTWAFSKTINTHIRQLWFKKWMTEIVNQDWILCTGTFTRCMPQ